MSRAQSHFCPHLQEKASLDSQVAPVVKNLPANAGDAREVGSVFKLERAPGGGEVATHSSILA